MELLLAFSSIGYIAMSPVYITTMQIPVFIAAYYFGWGGGTILGVVFGLVSMWNASLNPAASTNALFSPFGSPNPWGSFVLCVGTRAAFGFCAGWIFAWLDRHLNVWLALALGTVVTKVLHAAFVYAAMGFFFPETGQSAIDSLLDFTKLSSDVTTVFSVAMVLLAHYVVDCSGWGKRVVRALGSPARKPFGRGSLVRGTVFLLAMMFVAFSLSQHMITRIDNFIAMYGGNVSDQLLDVIRTVGLQFVVGMVALGAIIALAFFATYCAYVDDVSRAQKAKNLFFSNISHDMRTPLNGIIGFTGLALDGEPDPKTRDYLQKIQISSGILLDLVNDSLDMSKIENHTLSVVPEPTSVAVLIDTVTIPIMATAQTKGVDFRVDVANGPTGYACIDRLNVQKVLINLLSNAVKFTPAGGSVTFSMERLDPPEQGGNTRIVVSDTGVGIGSDFLPHIYEAFAQENGGRISNQPGTGLGLAIVKNLVDLMGGTISVESAPGKGTSFTLCLDFPPVEAPSAPDGTSGALTPPTPGATSGAPDAADVAPALRDEAPLAHLTALLCEDNPLNQEIAREVLERAGMGVICAENGSAGVEMLARSKPGDIDIVLMDVHMPVMNGFEAARTMRSLDRPDVATLPIMGMTADVTPEVATECHEAGMDECLGKPFDRNLLVREIARLAEASRADER